MSDEVKRGRGRPRGASRHADADWLLLKRVAEAVTLDATLKVTTAIRSLGVTDEAALRRLQRRWKEQGGALIEDARVRGVLRAALASEQEAENDQMIVAPRLAPDEAPAPAPSKAPEPVPAFVPFDPLGLAFAEWRRLTEAALRSIGRNIDAALAVQRSFQSFWTGR